MIKIYVGSGNPAVDRKFSSSTSIPCEEALLDAIVESEEVAFLKEFIDICYLINDERNAFLNLAFALYKGGKYAQGKRILTIPGLRSEDGLVPRYCEVR